MAQPPAAEGQPGSKDELLQTAGGSSSALGVQPVSKGLVSVTWWKEEDTGDLTVAITLHDWRRWLRSEGTLGVLVFTLLALATRFYSLSLPDR